MSLMEAEKHLYFDIGSGLENLGESMLELDFESFRRFNLNINQKKNKGPELDSNPHSCNSQWHGPTTELSAFRLYLDRMPT